MVLTSSLIEVSLELGICFEFILPEFLVGLDSLLLFHQKRWLSRSSNWFKLLVKFKLSLLNSLKLDLEVHAKTRQRMTYIKRDKTFWMKNIQLDLTGLDQNDKFHSLSNEISSIDFKLYFSFQSYPIKFHRGCGSDSLYIGKIRKP